MATADLDLGLDQIQPIEDEVILSLRGAANDFSRSNSVEDMTPSGDAVHVIDDEYDFHRQNRKTAPPEMHPLLRRLEEEEEVKHSEYTAHVLIQKQARDYALTVEDALLLLKTGAEKIVDSVQYWRGYDGLDEQSDVAGCVDEWMEAEPGTNAERLQLTGIGRKVIKLSEVIKVIQEKDALAFWTCDQRDSIFHGLVSLAKDTVKLRRKLGRIKESLEDRLRKVRRAAIKCECEITGNLVPSEIYYEWVAEDAKFFKVGRGSDADFEMAATSASHVPEEVKKSSESQKPKKASTFMKEAAKSILALVAAKSQLEEEEESMAAGETESVSSNDEDEDSPSNVQNFCLPVVLYYPRKYSQVEGLQKNSVPETESVFESDLQSLPISQNGGSAQSWTSKPSQKYLDAITSNVAQPQKFATNDFVFDNTDSRIKEAFSAMTQPNSAMGLDEEEYRLLSEGINNISFVSKWVSSSTSGGQEHAEASTSSKSMHSFLTSQMSSEPQSHPVIVEQSAQTAPENSFDSSPVGTPPKKLLSHEMTREIATMKQLITQMHNAVARTTWQIRDVERTWLSPPEELDIKSRTKKKPAKEMLHMIDFIVETVELMENEAFASRLYPEDRVEILSVLDPVLRELTNTFMTIYMLNNLVEVDINYLKQLMIGYPKGNLVVREWVSDPSIDEELVDIERRSENVDLNVDLDELFA